MQEAARAEIERRRRSRLRRQRREEMRAQVTPESVLGNIPAGVNTEPTSQEEIEMTVIEQVPSTGDGNGVEAEAGASGDANRPVRKNDGNEGWTVLQAWTIFGFVTCTVPWYVAFDKEKKEYVMKSYKIQQMLCIIQHSFGLIDSAMALPELPKYDTTSPFTYIQIAGIFSAILLRLWFAKIVFLNGSCIINYHNITKDMDEIIEEEIGTKESKTSANSLRRHKLNGKMSLVAFSLFVVLVVGLNFGAMLNDYNDYWKEDGFPGVIQTFACWGRKWFLWKNKDNCGPDYIAPDMSHLPSSEIPWGILGFETFINEKLARYQKLIAIDVCNLVFFVDAVNAMQMIRNTNQPAIHAYDHLKAQAKMMSEFAGPLLALQLFEIATNVPEWSKTLFKSNMFLSAYIVSFVTGFFPFVVLGCHGALIADRIPDELASERGRSSRPSTARSTAAFFFRLMRNTVGIGFSGVYVLNYAFLAGYMSLLGTYIMVLYEVEH